MSQPLRLSKISHVDDSGAWGPPDVKAAVLGRQLISLAVSLAYVEATAPDQIPSLQLNASPTETARRYAQAAQRLTSVQELLLSTAGFECVMMQGHYKVHFGRIKDAGVSFRQALHLAQRIGLPSKATVNDEYGKAARVACFRLLGANRALSLFNGEVCDDVVDSDMFFSNNELREPENHLSRNNIRTWRRLIERNLRIERAWRSGRGAEAVLHEELAKTLNIDQDMKTTMLRTPPAWWALSTMPTHASREVGQASFSLLTTTKDHFYTIVLAHLPYVLQAFAARTESSFTYSRSAAISASREVLVRFPLYQRFRHVPASFRAVEHKVFVAGIVILLAHMRSHRSADPDAIDHERPKDLGILLETIESMERLFARDWENPGSECARTLRRLMDIEQEMAHGMVYDAVCFYEQSQDGREVDLDENLDIRLPYFGTVRIRLLKACDLDLLSDGQPCHTLASRSGNRTATTTKGDHTRDP